MSGQLTSLSFTQFMKKKILCLSVSDFQLVMILSLRDICQCLETFGCHNMGEGGGRGGYWHLVGEDQGCSVGQLPTTKTSLFLIPVLKNPAFCLLHRTIMKLTWNKLYGCLISSIKHCKITTSISISIKYLMVCKKHSFDIYHSHFNFSLQSFLTHIRHWLFSY